ncbi:DUF1062 domain-containing protein [Saccharothrix coeruleofusca]|uniref:DUF1062 domain-containing protein n=1 Tax=Saccharothrix coeruleofusca TaxID=33919 RepID=UPI00278C6C8C|nr:DUF1062 domain-containing protein [Saccharothrix coeruleofusca]
MLSDHIAQSRTCRCTPCETSRALNRRAVAPVRRASSCCGLLTETVLPVPRTWVVVPTCLPLVLRRCHTCASGRFRASGKFRVNANHKLIDAWLLVLCAGCRGTVKLTVLERVNVRSVRPELLRRLNDNDPALIAELLQDDALLRRNRVSLDWGTTWRLDTGSPDHQDDEVVDVRVHFAARIPIRPARLIAQGCGLSRAEVERLIAEGGIVSAAALTGKLSHDFTFTLKR